MIFVGLARDVRLGDAVLLAEVVTKSYSVDLSPYPNWLVVLVGTLAAALVIWIGIKLLKLALWILFYAVLIGGFCWAGVLLLR